MAIDNEIIHEFVDAIKEPSQTTDTTYSAKVSRIDEDGTVWVRLSGAKTETPTAYTSSDVEKGDDVTVEWRNNKLYISGNYSKPAVGVQKVLVVENKASEALSAADKAAQNAINAKMMADKTAIDMANAVVSINADIADLQSQIDGNITSWFYTTDPSLNSPPVTVDSQHPDGTGWDTDEKKQNHTGDLYYNTDSGDAWRFVYQEGVYSWVAVADSAATRALEIASQAQDTADSKRRVFIVQPTPPYDVGDLWMQGTNGDIMTCTTPKASGGVYALSDWTKLNAYTDDTRANAAYTLASTAQTAANGKNKVYYTASAPTGGTYNDGDIWFNTSNGYQMSLYVENTGWVAEQFGNAAIADLSINNAKIANGTIQSAKIAALDVGKLTGGYIDASHINAGALNIGMNQVTNLGTTLSGKADTGDIPTAVSQLTNDSSYATTTQVSNAQATAISTASADATNKANAAQSAAISTAEADATTKANEAATKATSYIGIETDGIKVAKNVSSATSYALIEPTGFSVVKNNDTIAQFASTARIGSTSGDNYTFDASSMQFKYGTSTVAGSIAGYYQSNASPDRSLILQSKKIQLDASDSGVQVIGSMDVSSGIVSGGTVSGARLVTTMPYTGTSSTSNCRLLSASPYGKYEVGFTASSSKRYKHDIKPVEDESLDPHKLYELEVVQFVYNTDYVKDKKDTRYNTPVVGFVAEDVEKIYPVGVDYLDDQIETWNERYIIPPMLSLIQEQHKEIERLKAEMDKIKEQLNTLT